MTSSFPEQPNHNRPDLGQQEPGYTDRPQPRPLGATEVESPPPELPKLGSLAQTARLKQLTTARRILLVIGVIQTIFSCGFLFLAPQNIQKQYATELAKLPPAARAQISQAQLQQAIDQDVMIVHVINGGFLVVGVLFIVFGLIVKKYPLPVTITSLVLYILVSVGAIGVNILENMNKDPEAKNPGAPFQGIVIRILIIIALAKAIQAAAAYERESRQEDRLEPEY
jgi:hypothetical protein